MIYSYLAAAGVHVSTDISVVPQRRMLQTFGFYLFFASHFLASGHPLIHVTIGTTV
jgi:hypothetical protein